MKEWVAKNADYVKQQQAKHYQENKEHRIESTRNRTKALANCPIEKARKSAYNKKWRLENSDKHRRKEANRRAKKIERTPTWFSEFDEFVIQEAAELAVMREKKLGGKWHIDHIIPLQGSVISGLHVANNFEVVPQSYNSKKRNKFNVDNGASRFIG